jgi:thermolabile hemolysin
MPNLSSYRSIPPTSAASLRSAQPSFRGKKMRNIPIILGLAIAATLVPGRVFAATFSQLVVYGDSLSDLNRAFTATGGNVPLYGGANGGRFSNGPLWVEYLAAGLGIATDPNTNFAVGGATTGTVNTVANELTANGLPSPPQLVGIQQQVTNNAIGDPNALYIVWGGANDYLGGGIVNPTTPVNNLTAEISTLIARGAKNILVPNLPNLGALPVTRTTTNAAGLNLLTQGHNAILAGSIAAIQQARPDVTLNILDVNDLFTRAVNDPSQFNLTNVTDSCLLVGCTNPNAYLFWDTIHPTTAAHQLIGNLALSTVAPTAVPEPFTIIGTIVGGTAALRLRKKLKAVARSRS